MKMKKTKEIKDSNINNAIQDVINYIEHDAEIAIPINEYFNVDGTHITKKQYGHILLKYLVLELKEKYINTNNNTKTTIRVSDDDTAKTCIEKMADILNALNVPYTLYDDNDNDNDIEKRLLSISFEYKSNSTTSKLSSK